jgi:hypothetical protein
MFLQSNLTDMCEQLKEAIEQYLLIAPGDGWVKGSDLAARFDLRSDRVLRKVGDHPGLCTEFAISGNKGFKHIARATTSEFDEYYSRERQHNISGLVTLRQKRNRRHAILKSVRRPEFTCEKDTGQGVLFYALVT